MFTLESLFNSVQIFTKSVLREKKCSLNIEYDNNIEIYGELSKLQIVLTNLVRNAIDAYISHESKGEINIKAFKKDNFCIITIQDKAGGISQEIQDNLFKKMNSTKKQGVGFALYHSYKVINVDFKGELSFESQIGEGTIFKIKIPLNKKKEEE